MCIKLEVYVYIFEVTTRQLFATFMCNISKLEIASIATAML